MVYYDFKNYLHGKYIDKTFKIDWIKYDPLYQRFYSTVKCSSDGTEFPISKQGSISEEYIKIKNANAIHSYVNSLLGKEDFNKYISDIGAGVKDEQLAGIDKETDYCKFNYNIYIDFKYNSITGNKQFADLTYEIIKKLKSSNIKIDSISLDYEKGKEVYSLSLRGNDIDGQATDIQNHIRNRK
jgi:hypothetical protein